MNVIHIMVICSLLISLPGFLKCELEDSMVTLLNLFGQKKPFFIDTSKENQVKMTKKLSKNDMFMITKNNFINNENVFVIFFFKEHDSNVVMSKLSKNIQKGIIIFNDTRILETTSRRLKFEIDQEVYLFDGKTSEVYEFYEINNVKIKNKLGVVKNKKQFIWPKDVIKP